MQRITGYNLVAFINQLPKNQNYNYISASNRGLIRITRVEMPEGPIYIKRWDSSKGEALDTQAEVSISTEMIWRVANACFDGQPINLVQKFPPYARCFGSGAYNGRYERAHSNVKFLQADSSDKNSLCYRCA